MRKSSCCYGSSNPPRITMEDPKNTKGNKKEKDSLDLEKDLTEEELKGVSGGKGVTEQTVNNWIGERIHFLDPSA